MTRRKPRETELYHGTGASANLILIRKKGPGKYQAWRARAEPSGSRFQAFVYKPEKKRNMAIGTYDTALFAAVAAAVAENALKQGIPVYSPERPRIRKGAAHLSPPYMYCESCS